MVNLDQRTGMIKTQIYVLLRRTVCLVLMQFILNQDEISHGYATMRFYKMHQETLYSNFPWNLSEDGQRIVTLPLEEISDGGGRLEETGRGLALPGGLVDSSIVLR